MPEVQQEILWKPDSRLPHDDLARRPSTRYQLCDLCRDVLASPETLQPSQETYSVILCGGTLQDTQCSLRAMLLDYCGKYQSLASKEEVDKWADYESRNGCLTKFRTGDGDDAVLYIHPWSASKIDGDMDPCLRFRVQAYLDDPAADIIGARPFLQDLGSEEAFKQMREWIQDCEQSHGSDCGEGFEATTSLPYRVIDVQSLRLHQSSAGEVGKYAALTYCWGCQTVPGALVGANLEALNGNIRLESLPQTIKDAIFVTQRLGLRYIWIDAYCIIQDSIEDKNKQIARMGEVYSQAYVTLSASTSASVYDGFLHKRHPRARAASDAWLEICPYEYPRLLVPFRHPNRQGVTGTAVLQEGNGIRQWEENESENESKSPIMYRSWTFQERLLSRRVLIFGAHELYWQCNRAERSCGTYDETGEYRRPIFLSNDGHIKDKYIGMVWRDLIRQYSGRDITHEEDRLVALAGVASRFSETHGGKDVYLAGLWRSQMWESLLWVTKSEECSRPSVYVAPTWSWASVRTPDGITWWGGLIAEGSQRDKDGHSYLEIIQCETTLKTRDLPFGQVTGGKLRVRGLLRPGLCSHEEQDIRTTVRPSASWFKQSDNSVRQVLFDVDSEARDPSLLFYLRVEARYGLALSEEQPGVFRRVGTYCSDSKEIEDKFFLGRSVVDVEII